MPLNRTSLTTIDCASPADAARIATTMMTSWSGGGPKPDLIEANGAEIVLVWYVATIGSPDTTIVATKSTTGVTAGVTVNHLSNGRRTSSSD